MGFSELWLLCFVLCNAPLTTVLNVFKRSEGSDLSINCRSYKNRTVIQRGLCRGDCGDDDILVQTSGSRQTNGRYSVKHEMKGSPPVDLINVGISNLNLNDSGRYGCFWEESSGKRSYSEFMAEVTDGDKSDVHTAAAGQDFTHSFMFSKSGNKKSFCRNTCSEEDMLVETTGDSGRSDRYSLKYRKRADDLSFVDVTIKSVKKSDSGLYKCHLEERYFIFRLEVLAPSSAAPVTVSPSSAAPVTAADDLFCSTEAPAGPLTLILIVLIPVCVVLIAMTTILIVYCRGRSCAVCESIARYREKERERDPGGSGDQTSVYTAAAGEDFTHSFLFLKSGNKKSFCRNTCSEEDMLVKTTGDSGRSGRYSLKYRKIADDLSNVVVTIKSVKKSDSGVYQCHLDELSGHLGWRYFSQSDLNTNTFPVEFNKLVQLCYWSRCIMGFSELWLLCFVLCNAPLTTALSVFKRSEGSNLSVTCWSNKNRTVIQRGFCRGDCGDDDILVQTSGSGQTNGRYSVKHEMKGSPPVDLIEVGISDMNLNDSGRYSCFWEESSGKRDNYEFMAEVTDGDLTSVHTAVAGGDFTYPCLFYESGNKKSFCRNTCSEEDMLVETTGDSGRSGRYSLQYSKRADDLSEVDVTIKSVKKSDSGVYKCHLDEDSETFRLEVLAPPSAAPETVSPSSAAPETVSPSGSVPTQKPTDASAGPLTLILIVLIPVCVVLIAMTTILIVYCRGRSCAGEE
ncbi:hypothetical protein WMY93_032348 [Mugilogobius chulae]|uniref:Immunoglobulin domain-containing protein n=1 Tax=Mugilogobius chulae TaxID=88201 RepID=A0AAW0MVX1_9GOBI